MKPISWTPILSGEPADRARETLAEITASLLVESRALSETASSKDASPEVDFTLGNGLVGHALYFGYLHRSREGEHHAEAAIECLNRAIERASSEVMNPTLYSGFTGIAWAAGHLAERLFPQGETQEDPYRETDELLEAYVRKLRPPFVFDLISGPVGIGVYALERLPRDSARRCLEAIAERLEDASEKGAQEVGWLSPPEILPSHQRARFPDGLYNLGVAHGVPGILGLLAALWKADVARERVGPLLEGAVTWLLGQSLPPGSVSRFPFSLSRDLEPEAPARLAWCYGDPGIAAVLFQAAGAMDRPDWRREALRTARIAAERPYETAGIKDACLCHGIAGVAHIFNRLYQASGDEELGHAARSWFERLLRERTPGADCAGYRFFQGEEGAAIRSDNFGFLNGTAGVGLSLLAATTGVEPEWDRVMLTDIP